MQARTITYRLPSEYNDEIDVIHEPENFAIRIAIEGLETRSMHISDAELLLHQLAEILEVRICPHPTTCNVSCSKTDAGKIT
jgi:hypothetical protein